MPQQYSPISPSETETLTISDLDLEKPYRAPTTRHNDESWCNSSRALQRPHNYLFLTSLSTSLLLLITNLILLSKLSAQTVPSSAPTIQLSSSDPLTHQPSSATSSSSPDTLYIPFPNTTLFTPSPSFSSFANTSDALWHAMQTPNGGFFVRTLPSDNERHQFGISMFHALHCLSNIRSALQLLQDVASGTGNLTELSTYTDRWGVEQHGRWDAVHVGHCVDYVRQGILCAGDSTLEAPVVGSGGGLDMISGWGVMHQCRDADRVWEMSVKSGWMDPEVQDGMEGEDARPGWWRAGEMEGKTSGETG